MITRGAKVNTTWQCLGGFTILENLLAIPLLTVGLVTIAAGMTQPMQLVQLNREQSDALHIAQSLLEEEVSRGFEHILITYGLLSNAPIAPRGFAAPAGHPRLAQANAPFDSAASAQLSIRDVDGGVPGIHVLELRVTVCWRSGTRTFGDDTNLNGQEDAGEGDGDGLLVCPVVVETRLAKTQNQ